MGRDLRRSPVLDLLLLVTLFQASVPLFTAPMVVTAAGGETVVLCSVQGRQRVALGPDQPLPEHTEPCPACLLQHHLTGALPAVAVSLAPPALGVVSRAAPPALPGAIRPHLASAPIRAPPV